MAILINNDNQKQTNCNCMIFIQSFRVMNEYEVTEGKKKNMIIQDFRHNTQSKTAGLPIIHQ